MVTANAQIQDAAADAPLPREFISVADFTGTDSQKIEAAIFAATFSDHKTVFFPNGTYALRSSVVVNPLSRPEVEIHLIGESRDGVQLIPDIPHLEANYNGGNGAQLAHMIGIGGSPVPESLNVSIQNMTVDMLDQRVLGEAQTYNTAGHGIRVGQGWETGQLTVNEVTIRNTGFYGIGVQNRDLHPANNLTLTNLHIERTGSDAIDTKDADESLGGNQNLVIRDVTVNEIGFNDAGASNALDIRYKGVTIERVSVVSESRGARTGVGVSFRPDVGATGATVTDLYSRGFSAGVLINGTGSLPHDDIAVSDFKIQGHRNNAINILGTNHSGHTISDGYIDPASGGGVNTGGNATVMNVTNERWDPALTPLTDTTFVDDVTLAGVTYSPAWEGYVGPERVSLNPNASSPGPFVFDIGDTGVLQIDLDGLYYASDKLIVDGTLNLDGELRVNLIDGPPMEAGTFQVFDASAITGTFDTITLPPISGLVWNTDHLAVDGTLALLRGTSITLGDANTDYGASDPDDNPYVETTFLAEVQARWPNFSTLGLDQFGNNGIRAMTFQLPPLDPDDLESVTLEIGVNPLAGYSSDGLVLDSQGLTMPLSSLEGFDDSSTDPQVLRYEFQPSEFQLLTDGELSIALQDDAIVDWATLSWLETAVATLDGDYNNDGNVGQADLDLVLLNWGDDVTVTGIPADWVNGQPTGTIGQAQLDGVLLDWGNTAEPSGSTVPEPSGLACLAVSWLTYVRVRGNRSN